MKILLGKKAVGSAETCRWVRPSIILFHSVLCMMRREIVNSRETYFIHLYTIFTTSRLALAPTHPPIQWVPWVLSLEVRQVGVKLTTHLNLVLRSRMYGAIPPLPQYAFMAWCPVKAQGNLYFCLYFYL
jgi:hypothetical protein